MDFLKALFGEKALTYDELLQAINAHNGDEANKDKLIKVGNLGSGEYVSKAKHDALDAQLQGKITELTSANNLIEQLRKATKDDEELQTKISTYEAENEKLQEQLKETKLKAAVKVALLSEKAADVDYLTYKLNESLKEKGEKLELDENDNIKNWQTKLEGLKVQFPTMFGTGDNGDGFKPYEPNPLPNPNHDKTVTKEQFEKMTYKERVKLKQENEQLYKNLAKK